MAGNRQIYEQAMNDGHSAAWDQEWDKAIAAYARAIQELPEDPAAHNSLGLALLNAKRFDDALKVYNRAHTLSPDDTIPLEKGADVLERLGRLQEAAQKYVEVADVYLGQRDLEKAIGNWERATRLSPGLLQIHYRLAQAYERTGQARSALREYLTLAFNFQRGGDKQKAMQAVDRALRLVPNNPQAINAKQAIESDALMAVPDVESDKPEAAASAAKEERRKDERIVSVGESNPNGPLGEATEMALGALAETVLSGDLSPATGQVIQAIELQKVGEANEAAQAYLAAEAAGMRYSALYICLGAVLVEAERWQEAETYLNKAAGVTEYAAGAAHGLGKVYLGLGNPRRAAEELITALEQVDTSLAMSADEAGELSAVYDTLLKSTANVQDNDLKAMDEQFMKWLSGTDWKVRIADIRRSLSERLSSEGESAIQYYVQNTDTVDMVTRIDRYIKQGLLTLAMDEAFRAIEIEPTFLPVHQRVAQILMEEGHIQAAITKYNMVANSFLARDDTAKATEVLNEAISISPTDTHLRTSLIDLLQRQEAWDRVMDEYVSLANAYVQLADNEQARATYQEALRLAQKTNAPAAKRAEVYSRLADMDMMRLDLRQALRNYEQVRSLLPEDEAARMALMDLHFRLNNPVGAVTELDGLLRLFAQQRRGDQILSTLEQLVTTYPKEMALRTRLAAVYQQTNRRQDAIAQLDTLGEIQLEAGLYQDACATIKRIISLQPADTEQYRTLLAQLGC
ncbi:MAG TPA: tetratricopeptide repeat protein [Aggregatilineales bacterium]|nr:tetratricopeptide repeat protein [Aggregatilineales bacterium]